MAGGMPQLAESPRLLAGERARQRSANFFYAAVVGNFPTRAALPGARLRGVNHAAVRHAHSILAILGIAIIYGLKRMAEDTIGGIPSSLFDRRGSGLRFCGPG